jgi:hypothetical protein
MAHNMYKTKLVIPSTQTDIPPQQKLYGYAVLNRTVWYIINCAQDWNWIIYFTHDLQNILYYSVVFRGVGSFEKLGGPSSEGHFSKKKGT